MGNSFVYDKAYDYFVRRKDPKDKYDNKLKELLPLGTDYACSKRKSCIKRLERYGHYGVTTYSDKSVYARWWLMPNKITNSRDTWNNGFIYNTVTSSGTPDYWEHTNFNGVRPVMMIEELPKE